MHGNLHMKNLPVASVTLSLIYGKFPIDIRDFFITDRDIDQIVDKIHGLLVINAQEHHNSVFKMYIDQLNLNQKEGYMRLGKDFIVILPKGELTDVYFPKLRENQLLALYVRIHISHSMKQLQDYLENKPSKQ